MGLFRCCCCFICCVNWIPNEIRARGILLLPWFVIQNTEILTIFLHVNLKPGGTFIVFFKVLFTISLGIVFVRIPGVVDVNDWDIEWFVIILWQIIFAILGGIFFIFYVFELINLGRSSFICEFIAMILWFVVLRFLFDYFCF